MQLKSDYVDKHNLISYRLLKSRRDVCFYLLFLIYALKFPETLCYMKYIKIIILWWKFILFETCLSFDSCLLQCVSRKSILNSSLIYMLYIYLNICFYWINTEKIMNIFFSKDTISWYTVHVSFTKICDSVTEKHFQQSS